jgi:hypothetical protein
MTMHDPSDGIIPRPNLAMNSFEFPFLHFTNFRPVFTFYSNDSTGVDVYCNDREFFF